MNNESFGILLLLFAAMMFSIASAYVKLAGEKGVPSTELVFFRGTWQFIVFVPCMFFLREGGGRRKRRRRRRRDDGGDDDDEVGATEKDEKEDAADGAKRLIMVPFGRRHQSKAVVAHGFLGGASFVLRFYSYKTIPLGDVTSLMSLANIMTVFLAWAVLGEPVHRRQIVAALLSTVGAALVTGGPTFLLFGGASSTSAGHATAVLAALAQAASVVVMRRAGSLDIHTLQLVFSYGAFGVALSSLLGGTESSLFVKVLEEERWVFPFPSTESLVYVCVLCLASSVAQIPYNYAGRIVRPALTSILCSSDIVWGYLADVVFFQVVPPLKTCVGVLVIVTSIAMVVWDKLVDYFRSKTDVRNDTEPYGYSAEKKEMEIT